MRHRVIVAVAACVTMAVGPATPAVLAQDVVFPGIIQTLEKDLSEIQKAQQ
jgi:hypothetical protein